MAHTYQLAARLEGGEISELFRGMQDDAREVALKLFSPRFSDAEYGRALAEAARRAGELAHPSILHFEDVGMAGERLCCARAHLDGYHLGTALTRLASKEVVLPAPVALQIGVEVMLAVGAAHQAGLVHGALTPANVFVTRDGKVRVGDFLALWAMKQSAALRPLAERGRKAYRAPELARGAEPAPAADVYSVGAILYELLTLREVAGARGGGVSTRRDELVPPSRLDRRVHARLDPLILRALEPLKSRRHRNCLEQAEAFKSFLAQQGGAPSRAEIGKFVAELFPNEVSLAGSTSDLPITGNFSLARLADGASLPGLPLEVSERVSYSAPATDEIPSERPAEATTHEDVPRKVQTFSDWDAPPGELDPAVVRKLSGPAKAPVEELETQPLPRVPVRPRPGENFVPDDARTDINTQPQPAPVLLGAAEPVEKPAAPAPARVHRPRREVEPAPGPAARRDWHAKHEPAPAPRRYKTPVSVWAVAVLMAALASVLTYLAATHRERISAPPPPPKPTRHAWHRSQPAPVASSKGARPPRREPVVKKPESYCITLAADVSPAAVRIDGSAPIALPLESYPVGPGDHELVVYGHHRAKRVHVTEAMTRAPCTAQTILLARSSR